MNAESTPVKDNLKFSSSDMFDELTPIGEDHSGGKKSKYFLTRVKREVNRGDENESDGEPMMRSQVHKSYKKVKSKENDEEKADKKPFFIRNGLKRIYPSGESLEVDINICRDLKTQCSNAKMQFSDSGIDRLLVNVNYDLEKDIETFEECHNANNSNLKLFRNKLSNESLSASDVLNWSDSSLVPPDSGSYFCNLIKRKLFENAFNREFIKSQTSGWTQCELLSTQDHQFNDNSFHGLPSRVWELYEESKGIKKLFSWQKECLNLDAIKFKKNLVYSLPTSGGKSLVAEILILKELLIHQKNVLFILPFVSIVQEKMRDFFQFALELDFFLEEYAAGKGIIPPKKHRKKNSLMIATIEKGLVIVNSLIEAKRLGELGLVVVDELHLLSEEGRGPALETLLIKILHYEGNIQIVGMTATIGNLKEVAEFLQAESYSGNFRPVHLSEFIKCRNKIYSVDSASEDLMKEVRTVNSPYEEDSDGIAQLVQEIIPDDSVLIFCPTKKNCENVAALLSKVLSRNLIKHKEPEKKNLYQALVSEMNEQICPVLKQTLPFGVAYHHSGLTAGERKLLEEAFRQGTLSVICCTSTLAAGVNLPARRVILRSPYVGKDFISLSKYKQMVGRAGRTGLESEGDSFLICQPIDSEKVRLLFRSQMEEVISKMDSENCKDLVLSSIGLGTATTMETLRQLLKRSLLHCQFGKLNKDTGQMIDETIESLYKLGALIVKNNESTYSGGKPTKQLELNFLRGKKSVKIENNCHLMISRLGRAAMKGGLNLEVAHELYGELIRAQGSLVLLTNLHLLYLVTPHDLTAQIRPNFQTFFNVYMELDEKDIRTARVIGISESVVTRLVVGAKPKNVKDTSLNRFYISLIINELWNQKTVWDVAQIFQLPRGLVQTVMTSVATFANNVLRFCEELEEFWSFKSLLTEFAPRLAHCCSPELLPLMDLPSVKKGRAKKLYDAGFKSVPIIARSEPADLVRALDYMPHKVAGQIVAAAKLMIKEKAENLQEEAEIVLEGLKERFIPLPI